MMNLFGKLSPSKTGGALNGFHMLESTGFEIKSYDSFEVMERYGKMFPGFYSFAVNYEIPPYLFRVIRKHLAKEDKRHLHIFYREDEGEGSCIYTFKDGTWCQFSCEF